MAEFLSFEYQGDQIMVNVAQLAYAQTNVENKSAVLKVRITEGTAGYRHFELTGNEAMKVIQQLNRHAG